MRLDSVAADARILLLGVPHPSSRGVAAYLRTVLASGDRQIECVLATSADRCPAPGESAVYLRSDATDAVELAVMADLDASPRVLAAYALVADLDERWGRLSRLSLESVLARPADAVRMLLSHAGQPLDERIFAAAERCLPSVCKDVARYDHPLAFLAAVEADVMAADAPATEPPRALLVLSGQTDQMTRRPIAGSDFRAVTRMSIDDASADRLKALTGPWELIHLDHLRGARGVSDLLEPLLARLSPRGQLSGEERSADAAESVVAELTARCNQRGLVFVLSGREWRAAPATWWR